MRKVVGICASCVRKETSRSRPVAWPLLRGAVTARSMPAPPNRDDEPRFATVANLGSSSRFSGPGVERAVTAPRNNGQATGRDLDVSFRTQEAQMPTTFRMGLLADLIGGAESIFGTSPMHTLIAEADASKALGGDLQPAFGVEYAYKRVAFARAGKRFFNEQNAPWKFSDGMAIGGGLRLPVLGRGLMLDYAYVTMGELGGNQVLSFDFGF